MRRVALRLRRPAPAIVGARHFDGADGWAQRVTRSGGIYSANTLVALRDFERDLRTFGFDQRLVYLNPRCGDNFTAALVPLICRGGSGIDRVQSGTFAAWNELNGLANGTNGVLYIDCPLRGAGMTGLSATIGAYLLADCTTFGFYFMGQNVSGSNAWGLQPASASSNAYIILDWMGLRILTDASLRSNLTKGLIAASILGSTAAVYRNGIVRGNTLSANVGARTQIMGGFFLNAAYGQSGGDFVGAGFTEDEHNILFHMLHDLNTALGRQVVAEGVS